MATVNLKDIDVPVVIQALRFAIDSEHLKNKPEWWNGAAQRALNTMERASECAFIRQANRR